MGTYAQVETFFAGDFDKVLVGTNAGRFEGFRGELFVLVYGFVVSVSSLLLDIKKD